MRYDFDVNYKDISERISALTREIRNLQEMNTRYWSENKHIQRLGRAAHEARQLRLEQIKAELSTTLKRTDQRS